MNKDNYSVAVDVDIADIDDKLRPASEMREKLNDEAIQNYADNLKQMPPVTLIHDPTTNAHWLVDGCHTVHAALKCKRKRIQAIVKTGTYLEAFAEATHVNDMHGVMVTNADKRHRVLVALNHPEMSTWSSISISKACGVDKDVVLRLRPDSVGGNRQLNGKTEKDGKTERVVGKDGKSYPARKPRKKKFPPTPGANGSAPTDSEKPKKDKDAPTSPPDDASHSDEEEDTQVTSPPPELEVESAPASESSPTPAPVPTHIFDWVAAWGQTERFIMSQFNEWPEEDRDVFVVKLVALANGLRDTYYPDIIDCSNESLIRSGE
jgi:hypothetical protein